VREQGMESIHRREPPCRPRPPDARRGDNLFATRTSECILSAPGTGTSIRPVCGTPAPDMVERTGMHCSAVGQRIGFQKNTFAVWAKRN
jgi:hypothetical protein